MSFLCGSACQARKDQRAQADLLEAQAKLEGAKAASLFASQGGGMSTGAKIGIGFGVLLLIVAVVLIIKKLKK